MCVSVGCVEVCVCCVSVRVYKCRLRWMQQWHTCTHTHYTHTYILLHNTRTHTHICIHPKLDAAMAHLYTHTQYTHTHTYFDRTHRHTHIHPHTRKAKATLDAAMAHLYTHTQYTHIHTSTQHGHTHTQQCPLVHTHAQYTHRHIHTSTQHTHTHPHTPKTKAEQWYTGTTHNTHIHTSTQHTSTHTQCQCYLGCSHGTLVDIHTGRTHTIHTHTYLLLQHTDTHTHPHTPKANAAGGSKGTNNTISGCMKKWVVWVCVVCGLFKCTKRAFQM